MKKCFWHHIANQDEEGSITIIQRGGKSRDRVAMLQLPNIHRKKFMLCTCGYLLLSSIVSIKSNKPITRASYETQLMRLSRVQKEKRTQYYCRHYITVLLHDNARSHVATLVKSYEETLSWEILIHPRYSPDIAPSDYDFLRSMTHVDNLKRRSVFPTRYSYAIRWKRKK
ncbi:mariner Mos1 transposase [Trichonephila clavipes]|nr:mariner Mos1 transposase [Trichonephila clavipes]